MSMTETSPEGAQRLASHVLQRILKVKRGQSVMIESWTHSLPWARAFVLESRRRGAPPMVLYEDEEAYWQSLEKFGPKSVGTPCPAEWGALAKAGASIFFWGPGDRARFERLPLSERRKATAYNSDWYKCAQKAGFRGVRMEIGRATPSLAEAYGVDREAWERELVAASLVEPSVLSRNGKPWVTALTRAHTLRITHPNGTDVTIPLARRRPELFTGEAAQDPKSPIWDRFVSLPAGVLSVTLDGSAVTGTFVATEACYLGLDRLEGGRMVFEAGKLKEHSFGKGAELFDREYARGGKGRDLVSWMSIGLNPELHLSPNGEDMPAGNVTLGIGRNVQMDGKNSSSLSAYLSLAGAQASVDGKELPLPSTGPA